MQKSVMEEDDDLIWAKLSLVLLREELEDRQVLATADFIEPFLRPAERSHGEAERSLPVELDLHNWQCVYFFGHVLTPGSVARRAERFHSDRVCLPRALRD